MTATHNQPSVTYILPTLAWASLLEVIVREAPPGALIQTETEEMRALAEHLLAQQGRADVRVLLRQPPGAPRPADYAA